MGKARPWNSDLVVDWAEQQEEPDEETMSQVKVVYVKNLKDSVTEENLVEMFKEFGEIDRAKKIRDYAFIHFKERDSAVKVKAHPSVWSNLNISGFGRNEGQRDRRSRN